jgi:hypothetical protein
VTLGRTRYKQNVSYIGTVAENEINMCTKPNLVAGFIGVFSKELMQRVYFRKIDWLDVNEV